MGAQYLSNELYLGLDMKEKDDRKHFTEIVNEITLYERKKKRPLLGAIVLIKKRGKPYWGFFDLCEQLGLGKEEELKKDQDVLKKIRDEVYDFWRDDANYEKYRNE